MDYQPIDLSPYANADDDIEANAAGVLTYTSRIELWRGKAKLRGLPFIFTENNEGRPLLVQLKPDEQLAVPLEASESSVRTVTFAHRTRDASSPVDSPVGREDAVYVFTFSDGQTQRVPIREGFEIAGLSPAFTSAVPSLGVPDQSDSLPERELGAFADAGRRQKEVVAAGRWSDRCGSPSLKLQGVMSGPRYYLWSWINPRPEHDVVRIDIEARATAVEVGGVCVGYVDEHPLRPEPARVVVADVPSDYSGDGSDLALEIDRGTVGYTTALVRQPDSGDPFSTWGDAPDAEVTGVYARVSSVGSGTVRLVADGQPRAQAPWAKLREKGVDGVGGLRVTELGRNWVRTKIVDDATGEPVPCRVNFSSPDGVPYQPHGHHHHVNSDLSSFNLDVGADVRLGRTTYAYVDGACEGWLPRGAVRARVARGFEYQPVDEVVPINDDTGELTLRVRRLFDPTKDGWYSGDTHVHFLSSFGALREAAAEGLSVIHLLLTQWGSHFSNAEDFVGRPVMSEDGRTVLFASQENREHFLGHLSLLGLKEPVMPWCTGGPGEAEMGGGLEATLSDWADRCREQGGTVVIPHFPFPLGEQATLIATERVDAVELLGVWQDLALLHYYRYLNAGYRMPLSGGTDKMSSDVPTGISRTYVRLGADDDFGFQAWCDGLKAGRSYMSSGPILDLSVDGAGIGDTVQLPAKGGPVTVQASARSIFPMCRLELVHSGRVVASSESESGTHELRIDESVRIDKPGWICVRVGGGGPKHLTQHRDEWRRAIMAHTSPVYVACGEHQNPADREALEEIMALIERGRSYVESRAVSSAAADVLHHHGGNHREFLLKPFDHARTAIEHRLQID